MSRSMETLLSINRISGSIRTPVRERSCHVNDDVLVYSLQFGVHTFTSSYRVQKPMSRGQPLGHRAIGKCFGLCLQPHPITSIILLPRWALH